MFRHGLTREAVYSSILKRTRSRMHASAFAALEGQQGGTAEAVDLLADHAFRAELWPNAARYARQAAARAGARDANASATRFYEQALTAASHWEDGGDKDRMLLNLHLEARASLFRLGDIAGLRAHVDAAIALAERQDDHERLGNCYVFRSHALWLGGDPGRALEDAQTIARIAAARLDGDLAVRALYQEGLVYLTQSRVADTITCMRAVLDHLASPKNGGRYGLDDALAVTAHSYLARAAAEAGDFATAEAAVAEARAVAHRLGKRFSWIFADTAEGHLLLMHGQAGQAIAPLERAVATCRAADARLLSPVPMAFLAWAHTEMGDAIQGQALARQAVEDASRMGFLASQPLRLSLLARALLAGGAVEEASLYAKEAHALAGTGQEPGAGAFALRQLGEISLRQGRVDEGRSALDTAKAQATALGLHPLAASCGQLLAALAG
jgi:tetratricopeptide (TPR) repeat protein